LAAFDVDDSLAMPMPIGVHVTASILGGQDSPPENPTGNDPGLNQTNVFVDTSATAPKGKGMLTKHWILIGLALLAIYWFFFRGSSASLTAAAA
jgi:hypothetical protein